MSATATAKSRIPQYDPRGRLVGAVVLVIIAIIFLPMLFSRPEESADDDKVDDNDVVMEITSEGKKVFVSRIKPIEDQQAAETPSAKPVDSTQQAQAEPSKESTSKQPATDTATTGRSALIQPAIVAPSSQPEADNQKSTPEAKAASAAKAPVAAVGKKSSTAAESGWIVQVGSFSNKTNADNAAAKLRARGYTVHSTPVNTSKGTVTRVWLGPFSSKDRATKIQASIKRSTGMSAMIKTGKN
jgi:DedD protein